MVSVTSALVVAFAAIVASSPVAAPGPEITAAPNAAAIDKRATSCTFSGANGAALASQSQRSCATMVLSGLTVPSGTTLDLSNLADNTAVIFEGTTTWGYKEWVGPLLQISGNGIRVSGASGHSLNGGGPSWWDGKGANGGKIKPKFFAAHSLTSSSITNLHILNTPVQAVSIDSVNGLTITGMIIDNSAGDAGNLGHNTDGFDIGSSSGVTITGATVYNQDDCVAINSGTDITFTGGYCSGGHGLSIGSVGDRSDNTVDTVTFSNSVVKSSVNGIRVKAYEGATGTIKGVTYSGITLQSISNYGILIEQNYNGDDLGGGTASSGVPITGLIVKNISGSGAVSSSGYDVVITCGTGACTGWTWSGVTVTGGKKYLHCSNVPAVVGQCS